MEEGVDILSTEGERRFLREPLVIPTSTYTAKTSRYVLTLSGTPNTQVFQLFAKHFEGLTVVQTNSRSADANGGTFQERTQCSPRNEIG